MEGNRFETGRIANPQFCRGRRLDVPFRKIRCITTPHLLRRSSPYTGEPDKENKVSRNLHKRSRSRILARQGAPSERGDGVFTYVEPLESMSNAVSRDLHERSRSRNFVRQGKAVGDGASTSRLRDEAVAAYDEGDKSML